VRGFEGAVRSIFNYFILVLLYYKKNSRKKPIGQDGGGRGVGGEQRRAKGEWNLGGKKKHQTDLNQEES